MSNTARPFDHALRELRNGNTLHDLSDALTGLVQMVRDTGKAGQLTLTIRVRPATKNDASTVLIEDDVMVKPPKRDRSATIMFTSEDGGLSRKDPRQIELKLQDASAKGSAPIGAAG